MRKTPFLILTAAILFSISVISISVLFPSKLSNNNALASTRSDKKDERTALNYDSVKAMWISQFDMHEVYTDGNYQRDKNDYRKIVKKIIKNLSDIGINTVYFQLRPNGDSIYPSRLYPTSKYVSGAYGRELEYDPFQIFLDEAHSASISVHAWINPLRCMSETDISDIPSGYAVRDWYDTKRGSFIVVVDGYCYLNPAYDETRALIKNGVLEIIEKYDVDGIHIDDYFYPTTDESFDSNAYSKYGKDLSLGDFRREIINLLVKDVYSSIKSHNASLLFGISPSGNSARNYSELYADVALWCSETGYIDYICPQIYFGFEHETHAFDKVFEEFYEMLSSKSVKLIVGMTAEKAMNGYMNIEDKWAGEGAREWIENDDILKKSVEYVYASKRCEGIALFSYRLFFDPLSAVAIKETEKECENLYFVLKKI